MLIEYQELLRCLITHPIALGTKEKFRTAVPAGDHHVSHCSIRGPKISLKEDVKLLSLIKQHVGLLAQSHVLLGESKVTKLEAALAINQQIVWLQIPVKVTWINSQV